MKDPRRRLGGLFLACLFSLAASAVKPAAPDGASAADQPGDPERASLVHRPAAADSSAREAWTEAEGLRVMMGDSLDPRAHVFDSPDYRQELVLPGSGDIFLLDLRGGTFRILPRKAMVWTDRRLTPDLSLGRDGGAFRSDQGVVAFDAGGLTWRVEPEPPLVGPITLEQLRQAKPEYVFAANQYVPDRDAIARLKRLDTDTHIVVFFGTWCTYCRRWLPRFLKTIEVAANPRVTVEFIGVSESGGEPKEEIARYKVTETPTFVVFQEGKEVGRIENEPAKASIEDELAALLHLR